ncbi:unnamed protein product [Chrysoparadoxa australica]
MHSGIIYRLGLALAYCWVPGVLPSPLISCSPSTCSKTWRHDLTHSAICPPTLPDTSFLTFCPERSDPLPTGTTRAPFGGAERFREANGRKDSSWSLCVGDDAEVYPVPEIDCKYLVCGMGGATVRAGMKLDTPKLCTLERGAVVDLVVIKGNRGQIIEPVKGWVNINTESGYEIVRPLNMKQKYKVVYPSGAIVRNKEDIDKSKIVGLIPVGTIVEGTGRVSEFDGVKRIETSEGWISLCLREDGGRTGEAVLAEIE